MALPPVRTLPAFNFADNQLQLVMMGVRDAIYDLQGINKRSLVQDLGEGRKLSLEPDDRLLSTADLQTGGAIKSCLLYTSPSPRDATLSRMPSSA